MTITSTTMSRKPLEEVEYPIIIKKRIQNAAFGYSLKNDRMTFVHFQSKLFNITVIQIYAPTTNTEEAEVKRFYEDVQVLLELTAKKRCPFHHRGLECKSGSQQIPGVTGNFGLEIQNETGQRLIEFCQENARFIANTLFQQHKRRLCTWTNTTIWSIVKSD